MIEVRQTEVFRNWLNALADRRAVHRITERIERVSFGLFGDIKPIGGGVSELRIDHGPGYRVYFAQRGKVLVVLLCGGDKRTQTRDIKVAKEMAKALEE